MLEILELKAKEARQKIQIPSWVSDKNITLNAYNVTMNLMEEKKLYIKSKKNISDFKVGKHYQISASEIARKLGVSTSTITSKSSYSKDLYDFIKEKNLELKEEMGKVLDRHQKTLGAGVKQRKKDAILLELKSVKNELEILRKLNAVDQVKNILNAIPLPVKRKLGIDV